MTAVLFYLRRIFYLQLLRRKKLPQVVRDHLRACLCLDMKRSLRETDFVVLDTETTGLNARKGDRIVSISAVRLKKGRIDLSDSFHALVNPNRDIPSEAAVIHGILPRMVIGKPGLEEILPRFVEYIGSSVLVGHHIWLDMTFLNRKMKDLYGFSFQNVVVDTAVLDQAFLFMKTPPSERGTIKFNGSLSGLAERYRVNLEERHSSFGDALATAQIFQQMIRQAEARGISCLRDLLRIAFEPPSIDLYRQDVPAM
jgi:DNA polymerase III subunit epsilon